MIDGLNRTWADATWERLARPLVRIGVTPNHVTWIGMGLVALNCALFYVHRNTLIFGLGLAFSFAFDALDGAVARLQHASTRYGAYLDGVLDRYQEIAVYLVIAIVTGWWAECFLAVNGSLMVSYNKARTAIEIPISNHAWPDLLERFERIVILCIALIADAVLVLPDFLGARVLYLGILVVAVLSHVTAVQRFIRARALLLRDAPRKD